MDMEAREDGSQPTGDGVSRHEFLKQVSAGLGAAGLATLMAGQALAEPEKKGRYVVVATHGGNDPNRAILSLLMAFVALDKGLGPAVAVGKTNKDAADDVAKLEKQVADWKAGKS